MSFSAHSRSLHIEKMKSETFDVVIIGGGINGAGIARDAASRGMRVALVEARDFASGTSSRSSKLIHGGLRYLESFEFALVFEALSERRKLFEMAPNLVHPLRFVLPVYKNDRVGMFKMGLGMMIYDMLALFDAPKSHRRLDPKETVAELPQLNADDLLGSFAYYDAYMDDDRLVHETLRSAHSYGAISSNYVEARGAKFTAGRMSALECFDSLSGDSFAVQGRHFVSTVGPWTDEVAQSLLKQWAPVLRPSKGVHLTFERKRFPLKDAVVMAADQQRRIIFGIPRHDMVILGTTDTDFRADPKDVNTNADDVKYLLKIANEYFPGADLKESDIVASYSGVRPLVADGSASESSTSREHTIINDPRNITFVAGGKYTTYRHMAEESVKSFLCQFTFDEQVKWARSRSEEPLNPKVTKQTMLNSREQIDQNSGSFPFAEDTMHWLVDRHGEEAFDLLGLMSAQEASNPDESLVWKLEARHAIRNTMCLSIADFYLRRVPLFLTRFDHGYSVLEAVSEVFSEELGLTESQLKQQIDALDRHKKSEMGWRN